MKERVNEELEQPQADPIPGRASVDSFALQETDVIWCRYVASLKQALTKVMGSSMDAEDVLQDMYLVLDELLGKWKRKGDLGSWLCRIAHNRASNYMRRRRWLEARSISVEALPLADNACPRSRLELNEIKSLLDRLPPEERKIVKLHFWQKLSVHKISKRTNRSIRDVSRRLHWSLKELKSMLRG